MKLSPHFTLEELTASQTAVRKGIPNAPSPVVVANLTRLAATLEQVRALTGPVSVSSGYRSFQLNAAVGGAKDSVHTLGLAADITVSGMSPRQLATNIRDSDIEYDQLIYEGTWVHLGLSDKANRRECLTATFKGGKASYSIGIV